MKFQPLLTGILLLAPTLALAQSHQTPTPAEIFSQGAQYTNVKISPSGDYLSVIMNHEGKDKLLILNTEDLSAKHIVYFPGNAQVGSYTWVNDERVVVAKEYLKGWDDRPLYYGELMAVNADGSKVAYLFGYNSGQQQTGSHLKKNTAIQATAYVLDPLPDDDRYMLVNAIPWNGGRSLDYEQLQDVYRVDVYRGTRKKITRSPIGMASFMTDDDGEVRFVAGQDRSNNTRIFYRNDGEWIDTDKLNIGLKDFTPISFTEDPNSVYAAASQAGEPKAVYRVNLKTGEKQQIVSDARVEPDNFWINGQNKQLYAVEFANGYPTYAFVDSEDQHAVYLKQLLASLPGHQVRIVSETRNADKMVILAFNDRNPGDYYLFDTKAVKLRHLLRTMESIDPANMAEVKPMDIKVRDGMTIQAYLTLPPGKDPKQLPLVVNPHGGPHYVRDSWGFDPQNQMLANQGIAVLQVNFRGSGGYGEAFQQAGYRKWGSEIQYDIIDATRHLIDQGIVDKQRICIVGGSFGGYSALQSSVMEPDLFKCAIGFAGVYDLEMMFKEGDVQERDSGTSYLRTVLGQDQAVLRAMSPTRNVDKLKANLLLVHGGNDERAPIEQFEALEDALKKRNYPYQKIIMDDEGHGFYDESHRAIYYQKMLNFLKQNLGV
ncbi:alpha/beta hydrolase family protein [Shewanella chilikensis]|jgi:dipeptidyl aminopeptidase/acylaminoacyl peptidase|uniref:Dipeptidyl aminopeptidase/acylaminoacyl peptidase n=1 Tax=Shewanella chilikensis TaxID=558541 RepID=A0ABX5PJA0_9GAMM|nr:S9 family peptidase [Shewanella chilikensis]MCL1155757.1 S9 family peptidase [Shewanella chilikensis]PYE55609.1 dipeptidyl aminopeptidase/acylaminoacyl peptidase [Shewanella chilikensis]GGZ41710.1 peptidase S9 [Shewanella chilikensis]